MDSQDQARVFKRVQERFNIDEINPDNVNEYLRNKPSGNRTYEWQERKHGHLVKRERTVYVKFSNKKDAIAKKMGEASNIYNDARKYGKLGGSNKVQKRLSDFEYTLTDKNLELINTADFNRASELMEDLFNSGNISGYKVSFTNSRVQERADNEVANLVNEKARVLRDQGDIGSLEDLRDEAKGIKYYDAVVKAIDEALESARKKLERFEQVEGV